MPDPWTDAASQDVLIEGDVVAITVAGREVALYEVEGVVFATDNRCTHGAARMSDGFLEGREIECPLHQGRFDVCSGKALCAPLTEDLRSYPVRLADRRIWLQLD